MNQRLALFAVLVIASGLIGSAHAHKSQIVGNYEIIVGWQDEPPMIGKENAITIMITHAPQESHDETHDESANEEHDGEMSETHGNMTENEADHTDQEQKESNDETSHDEAGHDEVAHNDEGVTGLASILEVTVTLNDEKTTLELTEDEDTPGLYIGEYTPTEAGHPTVHVFVTIDGEDVETSIHPEKVEETQTMSPVQQQKHGTPPNEVECAKGLTLLAKKNDGSAICVKKHTAELLISRGLAIYF